MTTYYIYSADGKHDYLGTISVSDKEACDTSKLICRARRRFRVDSIRIDLTRKTFAPPRGRVRVAPDVARRPRTETNELVCR